MAKLRQVIHPVQGLQPESDNFELLRSQKWTHWTQHLWSPPGNPHAGSPMLACGAPYDDDDDDDDEEEKRITVPYEFMIWPCQ